MQVCSRYMRVYFIFKYDICIILKDILFGGYLERRLHHLMKIFCWLVNAFNVKAIMTDLFVLKLF